MSSRGGRSSRGGGSGGSGRRLRAWAAAVAAGVVGVTGLITGTGAAAAADPPPPVATIDLAPGSDGAWPVIVADDAVYFADISDYAPAPVYRRSLTTSGDDVTVGAPELIGRAATGGQSMAEDDGALAYVRGADGRVVVRAADGTETLVDIDEPADVAFGISALADHWLVGIGEFGVDQHLINRATGAEVDLLALSGAQAAPDGEWSVNSIAITDTRVAFGISWDGVTTGERHIGGVYTAELDADGVVGDAVELDRLEWTTDLDFASLYVAGVDGETVLWASVALPDGSTHYDRTLRWFTSAPYTGDPAELQAERVGPLELDGTTVIASRWLDDGTSVVEWIPLTGDPTPTRSVAVEGSIVLDADGTLVAHSEDGGWGHGGWLSNAAGALTGDQTPLPAANPFRDTGGGDPFAGEILSLYDRGIMNGFSDGSFRGGWSVNRDAMAAFLHRLANPGVGATPCTGDAFADVPAEHPFCAEIAWLADAGITTGYPDGDFRPGIAVTREAMAAFLYRFTHDGADAPACTTAPFADVTTGHPFCGEIAWLAETGISTGWSDGTYRPGAYVERQAMAAFLYRLIDEALLDA